MNKLLLIAALFISSISAAFAQAKTIDKIVGKVGNNIILESDIDQNYQQYVANGQPVNKCQILQSQLVQKLLKMQAERDSVSVDEATVEDELDRRIRNIIRRAGGQQKLEEFLNKSIIQYKDELRPDVREQLVAQKMQGTITKDVNVTPMEIEKYYKSLGDTLPQFNTEVEVAEISLLPKLTRQEKQPYYDKAEALRQRIIKGEDFATLAKANSEDPGSAPEGGDLGFFQRGVMAKEFTAYAFRLKAGEISPVFETPFGYHFLQVIERRGEEVHARHILIIPQSTPESMARVKIHADSIYNNIENKKIDFAAAAAQYSDNEETKYTGGNILNSENVSRSTTVIPVEQLDPTMYLVIDTLKAGQVARPFLYTDRNNKPGYRIVMLKSKVPPHTANLTQDYAKIKAAALEQKTNIALSNWFDERRKNTYVHIDPEYATCPELRVWLTQ